MRRENQHGGRGYDGLQNLLDTTSHETPLLGMCIGEQSRNYLHIHKCFL